MARLPALYRMPVFYAAALVAAGGWSLVRGWPGGGAGPASADERVGPIEGDGAALGPLRGRSPSSAADAPGLLRAADGSRRMAVVARLDVTLRRSPLVDSAGPPLDYDDVRFVYDEAADLVRVGTRTAGPSGWAPRESLIAWDTPFMARPTAASGRPPLTLFREAGCASARAVGRACPRHNTPCPTEGEEAGPVGTASYGWPVLAIEGVSVPGGSPGRIIEVAAPVADRGAIPPVTPRQLDALRPALRHVYVAFAIDTTASMAASLDAARKFAGEFVAEAIRRHPAASFHLAIVEYRDDSPQSGFKARVAAPFTEAGGFRAVLRSLEPARRGDGTVDEAVLDGVLAAMPGPPGTLAWPSGKAGELATKLVVLLGDAPDHARDPTRAVEVAARARRDGVAIAAVALDRSGTLSADEQTRYDAQWRALADGSHRAGPALRLRPHDSPALLAALDALLENRVAFARGRLHRELTEAEARLGEYVDSRGRSTAEIATVLVDRHEGEAPPVARPDPRLNGRKAPSIRRGWVVAESDGTPLVGLEVLLSRAELDVLIAELAAAQQWLTSSTGPDDGSFRPIAGDPDTYMTRARTSLTFAAHLKARRLIPLIRPDSLLERTQADLVRAGPVERATLLEKIKVALRELTRRRGALRRDDPGQVIDGLAPLPYDWLDF